MQVVSMLRIFVVGDFIGDFGSERPGEARTLFPGSTSMMWRELRECRNPVLTLVAQDLVLEVWGYG